MAFFARIFPRALLALLCASLSGCGPSGRGQFEEEKEPHFIDGKNAINTMDYKGAIESFHKALEVNPQSASAHFQLGWLYEEKEPNPAAAIYHYERFLKLRPGADNTEFIRQRIMNCKQDLARTVLPLPTTPRMQRELEQLAEENKRLREEVERWRVYYQSQSTSAPPPSLSRNVQTPALTPTQPPPAEPRHTAPPVTMRTHTVQPGETLSSIARQYGVRLEALMAANPGLEPRRMRVGQVVNVPPS